MQGLLTWRWGIHVCLHLLVGVRESATAANASAGHLSVCGAHGRQRGCEVRIAGAGGRNVARCEHAVHQQPALHGAEKRIIASLHWQMQLHLIAFKSLQACFRALNILMDMQMSDTATQRGWALLWMYATCIPTPQLLFALMQHTCIVARCHSTVRVGGRTAACPWHARRFYLGRIPGNMRIAGEGGDGDLQRERQHAPPCRHCGDGRNLALRQSARRPGRLQPHAVAHLHLRLATQGLVQSFGVRRLPCACALGAQGGCSHTQSPACRWAMLFKVSQKFSYSGLPCACAPLTLMRWMTICLTQHSLHLQSVTVPACLASG